MPAVDLHSNSGGGIHSNICTTPPQHGDVRLYTVVSGLAVVCTKEEEEEEVKKVYKQRQEEREKYFQVL